MWREPQKPKTKDLKSKNFPHPGGGGFSATKIKVARNCLKWIDLKSKNLPSSCGGGFSATKIKVARNCLKWIDLKSKIFPHPWGGLFCHKNQSCLKLPKMDRSEVKNFSLILGGGGAFLPQKSKLSKLPKMDRTEVKKFPSSWGGGLFCHKNQSCSKLPKMDRSEVKKFPSSWGGGGGFFCQVTTNVRFNDAWNIGVWSYVTIWAEYLTKRQKRGGAFRPICSPWALLVEYSSLSF